MKPKFFNHQNSDVDSPFYISEHTEREREHKKSTSACVYTVYQVHV